MKKNKLTTQALTPDNLNLMIKSLKSKSAFAQGKDAWASTLKSNAQSKYTVGKTSQNKKK